MPTVDQVLKSLSKYGMKFSKSIQQQICFLMVISFLNVFVYQMSANELEEDYNSSTIAKFYIDFDGDGEFDLEDDAEDQNEKSCKGKLSFDCFLTTSVMPLFSSEIQSPSCDYASSRGFLLIARLFRPPNAL